MKRTHKLLLSLLSGSLLFLSFNIPLLWLLGFIALVPLLLVLKNSQNSREAFAWSFLVGFTHFGAIFSFFFETLPLNWMGVENYPLSLFLVSLIWFITTAIFSSAVGLWGIVAKVFIQNLNSLTTLGLAASWSFAEWLGAFIFSVLSYGNGSYIGGQWTFGHIGYILAEFPPLLSLASVGGIHLLSFTLVVFNLLIFLYIFRFRTLTAFFFALFLVISGLVLFAQEKESEVSLSIAAVQSNIKTDTEVGISDQVEAYMSQRQVIDMFERDSRSPELIILPEGAAYFNRFVPPEKKRFFANFKESGALPKVLDSYGFRPSNQTIVRFRIISENKEEEIYKKILLTPFGEYTPTIMLPLMNIFLDEESGESYRGHNIAERGSDVSTFSVNGAEVGALFCSEVYSPELYRQLATSGSGVLVNSSSHSLFGYYPLLVNQTTKQSKVRAVENGRYFIQAGNVAPTFIVNNKGEVLSKTNEQERESIMYADVPVFSYLTIFSRLGTSPFLIAFLSISLLAFLNTSRKTKAIHNR
ncbi:MAG: apolipoprotein N-acyltransferase [Candidatus Campbellbacteria bacterium]|nr:apolipoprotein N-acyltransferase [Candidatus Campbellbacteria bacterium]